MMADQEPTPRPWEAHGVSQETYERIYNEGWDEAAGIVANIEAEETAKLRERIRHAALAMLGSEAKQ